MKSPPDYPDPLLIDKQIQDFVIKAQSKRLANRPEPQPPNPKIKAKLGLIMSVGRLGFTATYQNAFDWLGKFSSEGVVRHFTQSCAFWHHTIPRNIEQALMHDFEYLFFLDGDTVMAPEDLDLMVKRMDDDPTIDIAFPVQADRNRIGPLAWNWKFPGVWPDTEYDFSKKILDYPHGHFGGAIARTSLFRRLPQPWLRDIPDPDGSWNEGRLDADTYFWVKLHWMNKTYGTNFRSVMFTDVVAGHLEQVAKWQAGPQVIAQSLKQFQEYGKPEAMLGAPLHDDKEGLPWRYG